MSGGFDTASLFFGDDNEIDTAASSLVSDPHKRRSEPTLTPTPEPSTSPAPKKPRQDTKTAEAEASKEKKKPAATTAKTTTVTTTTTTTTTAAGDDKEEISGPRVKGCVHEVALPPGWSGDGEKPDAGTLEKPQFPSDPSKLARTWKFQLDPFQRNAIACIERQESVLVSAHTSAGKTVVAEYAIALALREGQRVIYTSPIKALSNQKYRELQEEFKDVGLMTGDITINPHATCLVMTTEILRSMLYRGSEVVREVAWVIFDEIHYLRNKERGVVWEETIIMLPDTVKLVFLSATIPNAKEFAGWIAQTHSQPCHVVYTDMRPVPLQHYIFPAAGEGLHLVVDEKGNFREDNFNTALMTLAVPENMRNATKNGGSLRAKRTSAAKDCERIVKMIMDRSYQPVIVFAFSKKETETLALQMANHDFTTTAEKQLIMKVYTNAIDSLSQEDKQLPQISNMLPLLGRGIGIHHSGLLPILKEVIEILFQEGLVKALFATETFSMGLNMPAKTVVFTSVRKFDGDTFREVTSGEYIQMSGRAGRRGLDERGIVIMMVDEKLEPATIKGLVWGESDPLNSAFRVSYSMLLNLLRVDTEGAARCDPDSLVKRSFRQFQAKRSLPVLAERAKALEKELASLVVEDEETVSELYFLKANLAKTRSKVKEFVTQPIYLLPFLQPGRIVHVVDDETGRDWGFGAVVSYGKKPVDKRGPPSQQPQAVVYVVEVILECESSDAGAPIPLSSGGRGQGRIVPVSTSSIDSLSSLRIYLPSELKSSQSRNSVVSALRELKVRFPDGVPPLDPVKDMKIEDDGLRKLVRQVEKLDDRVKGDKRLRTPEVTNALQVLTHRMEVSARLESVREEIKEADQDVILGSELRSMKRVLRRLGYITGEGVVETKGRVAAVLTAGEEIVLTELVFSGLFNDMSPQNVAALMSCFVNEEKSKTERLPPQKELLEAYRQVQETARRVATVWKECLIEVEVEDFVQSFSPALMEPILAWCNGSSFADVLKLTDIFEGSVIRMMRRLEELLKELVEAAKSIGNGELESKFGESITKLHRDIVFAASLYL